MNTSNIKKAATVVVVGAGLIFLYEKIGDNIKLSKFKKYGDKLKKKIINQFVEEIEEVVEEMEFENQRDNYGESLTIGSGAVDNNLSANNNEEGMILYY